MKLIVLYFAVVLAALSGESSAQTVQASQSDRTVIPLVEPKFEGIIGKTYQESTAAWPTGMGFEYFYGFIGGETHQYYPVLFENTRAVEPKTSPEEGYHLMTDLTDRAINYIQYSKSVAPQKPFFLYFAPGAAHAPHHAPKDWSHKFKGQFDQGWEKVREETYARQLNAGIIPPDTRLTPRPNWVPAWDSLSADQKKL